MVRILVADNHVLIREGIRALLSKNKELTVVGEVEKSEDLVAKIKEYKPNIILIDYHLPGFFEIRDIAGIYKKFPKIKILVLTTNQNKDDISTVLNYGVNNYILKECDKNEIISAVYATAKGEKFFCGKVVDAILDKKSTEADPCEPTVLSIRETEIVRHIAEGSTNKKIAEKLFLSVHTVNTHRKNILKKLRIKNTSELILFAINKDIIDPSKIKSPEGKRQGFNFS
jgi:DNA-binding NarL/FixJ family response regulator